MTPQSTDSDIGPLAWRLLVLLHRSNPPTSDRTAPRLWAYALGAALSGIMPACDDTTQSEDLDTTEQAVTAHGVAEGSPTALRMLRVANDPALLAAVPRLSARVVASVNGARPPAGYQSLDELDAAPVTGLTFFRALVDHVGRCRDGKTQSPFEACDDANDVDTDACNNVCQLQAGPAGEWRGTFSHGGSLVIGHVSFPTRATVTLAVGTLFRPATCYGAANGAWGYQKWSGGSSFVELSSPSFSIATTKTGYVTARVLPGTYDVVLHTSSDCNLTVRPALAGNYSAALTSVPDASRCGDGHVDRDLGEACDDGGAVSGDGCEADCTLPVARCGNNVIDPGEECDGNFDASYPSKIWACDDTCHIAESVDVDPREEPNFADYASGKNILELGSGHSMELASSEPPMAVHQRSARGVLAPGDVDRITFAANSITHGHTNGSAVETFALRGHVEIDCTDASVAFSVREPQRYRAEWGVLNKRPTCLNYGTCRYTGAMLLDRSPVAPESVGLWGAALRTVETRYVAEGVCPSKGFVLEPSFCVNGDYETPRCFWPVLDIQADDAWTGPPRATVPWRFVVDSLEPRRVKVEELW